MISVLDSGQFSSCLTSSPEKPTWEHSPAPKHGYGFPRTPTQNALQGSVPGPLRPARASDSWALNRDRGGQHLLKRSAKEVLLAPRYPSPQFWGDSDGPVCCSGMT